MHVSGAKHSRQECTATCSLYDWPGVSLWHACVCTTRGTGSSNLVSDQSHDTELRSSSPVCLIDTASVAGAAAAVTMPHLDDAQLCYPQSALCSSFSNAGRYGQPEEIAGLVRFLATDPAAAYITGQVLPCVMRAKALQDCIAVVCAVVQRCNVAQAGAAAFTIAPAVLHVVCSYLEVMRLTRSCGLTIGYECQWWHVHVRRHR